MYSDEIIVKRRLLFSLAHPPAHVDGVDPTIGGTPATGGKSVAFTHVPNPAPCVGPQSNLLCAFAAALPALFRKMRMATSSLRRGAAPLVSFSALAGLATRSPAKS